MDAITIRRLQAVDGPAYRSLRLEALERHPASFGRPWRMWPGTGRTGSAYGWSSPLTFGAFRSDALLGAATLALQEGAKLRHKGDVTGSTSGARRGGWAWAPRSSTASSPRPAPGSRPCG